MKIATVTDTDTLLILVRALANRISNGQFVIVYNGKRWCGYFGDEIEENKLIHHDVLSELLTNMIVNYMAYLGSSTTEE